VARQFPRRDEFARLLDEVKQLRQEMTLRLELQSQEMHQRMDLMQQQMDLMRQDMERRFEQVDKRFEQMDNRFEQVDNRFEQVDKRFEQVDNRFEQVDKRFEQVDQQLAELRRDNVQIKQDLGKLQENVGKLQVDNVQIKRDILKLQAGQTSILKTLNGQEAWLRMTIGILHSDKGQILEDLFAAGLRYGLKDDDITPETIRLRTPLTDFEGLVFKKGYVTEVDVVAQNGKLTVFEVKATAKAGDVDMFAWKVELVRAQSPTLSVRGVFICIGARPAVKQRCLENGLELLD
jgi:hypothetical protein